MKKILLSIVLIATSSAMLAQVGIGTTNPHTSAVLDVESTTKGFLPPRVSSDSDVTTPADGLVIYDISDKCLNVWNNSVWVNLCENTGGTSTAAGFSDTEVFTNIRISKSDINPGTNHIMDIHLSEDGTKFFSNEGHLYDVNSSAVQTTTNAPEATMYTTVPVNAVSQVFPGEVWKDFLYVSKAASDGIYQLFMLSEGGVLHSMNMHEYGGLNRPINGIALELIDPTDDNKTILDTSANSNDYRFTPYTHLADGTDATVKFSSIFMNDLGDVANPDNVFIYAYDKVNNKMYSMGANTSGPAATTPVMKTTNAMSRIAAPATLKESVTLREAVHINNMLSHFNTQIVEGDNTRNSVFFTNSGSMRMFTTDGFINQLDGTIIRRIKLPAGVTPVEHASKSASFSMILGSDGNLYKSPYSSSGTFSTSNVTVNGTMYTIHTGDNDAGLVNTSNATINAMNIKKVIGESNAVIVLTDQGKSYLLTFDTATASITKDHNAGGVPILEDILLAHSNAAIVAKLPNGQTIFFNAAASDDEFSSVTDTGYLGNIGRMSGGQRFAPDSKLGKFGTLPRGRLFFQYTPIKE